MRDTHSLNTRQTYIRMPEELHKELRIAAAVDDVSLNTCVLNLLREALEARRASPPRPEHTL